MPGVIAFGRQWLVAGDDLLVPAVIGFSFHAIWISVFVFILSQTIPASSQCEPRMLLVAYLAFNIAICSCQLVIEAIVCWTSLRGTVSDDKPRRGLKFWIPVHTFFVFLDFWAQGLGFYLIAGPSPLTCPGFPAASVVTKACVALIFISLLAWLITFGFMMLRSSPLDVSSLDHRDLWLKRMKFICSGHRNQSSTFENGDVLRDVARIFADFFQDADTVVSDVMVGLIYVRRKQRLERNRKEQRKLAGEILSETTSFNPEAHPAAVDAQRPSVELEEPDGIPLNVTGTPFLNKSPSLQSKEPVRLDEMEDITHFIQYAEAIYGLPLYMLTNFFSGLQFLIFPSGSCWGPAISQTLLESVRTHLGRPGWPFCCIPERPPQHRHADLLAISLDNGIYRSPYIIALDHDKKAVVVAIRGTLSTADVLVDLNCDLATIQVPWEGRLITARTHAGMLMTAGNIRDEISGLLEELLLSQNSQYHDYRLVVCGHSLGAGVASLLSYLLNLKGHQATCFAYSPPGCISTAETIPYFSSFCTSIVLGDDIVPRLNRRTIERLKVQVKAAVRSCRRRKVEVLGGFILADLFGIKAAALDSRDDGWWEQIDNFHRRIPGLSRDDTQDVEAACTQSQMERHQSSSPLRDHVDMPVDVPAEYIIMHVPGRVLYLKKERMYVEDTGQPDTGYESPEEEERGWGGTFLRRGNTASSPGRRTTTTMRRKKKTMYRPTWVPPQDINDIVISATMGADHLPNSLGVVLRRIWDSSSTSGNVSPATYW
ncbi:hypothetical protein HDU67_010119 [Dinochytrium kinnereticum]|nr:hypothetical protein HDU67_010119 [Dinochytrium kinnereticum]